MMKETMKPDTKLQRTRDVIATDMNGETVMMHIEKGTYFALTGSGGQIWAALESPAMLKEVIEFIESEYDVSDVDNFDIVVSEFVSQLIEQGLVTAAD